MANFCRNCGAPLGANFAFCPQCRTPAAGGANPMAAAAAPLAPAAKTGSGMKILLVILCVLAVGGVAVVGGLFYVAHRVKQAVVARASEYGVDIPSRGTGSSAASIELFRHPCDLLTKEEAASLLGEPIDRTEVRSGSCLYYGPVGLSARLGKESMSTMVNKPNASTDGKWRIPSIDF
jgi:phosphate/sulfate permease